MSNTEIPISRMDTENKNPMSNETTWFENALSAMTTKGEAYSEKAGRAVLTNVCEERLTIVKEKLQKRIDKYDELGENLNPGNHISAVRLKSKVDECEEILTLIEEELQ